MVEETVRSAEARLRHIGYALVLGAALIAGGSGTARAGVVLSADFEGNTDGFSYADDVFYGTNEPGFAEGQHDSGSGHSGDSIRVKLGSDSTSDAGPMSGGFSATFNLSATGDVEVNLWYRLWADNEHESDECRQIMVSVDGTIIQVGGNDYLLYDCDGYESGSWQSAQLDLGQLSAGNHTLTLGAYANKKNHYDEIAYAYFDDVSVEVDDAPLVANDASFSTDEDTPKTLAYDIAGGSGTPSFTITSQPANGSASDNGNGTFTFNPGTDFWSLNNGQSSQVSFGYEVSKGGETDTGTITVTVNGITLAANNMALSYGEDDPPAPISFDVDGPGQSPSIALTSQPALGSVVNNGNGTFSFDPGQDFQALNLGESDVVSFGFEATKGTETDTATVTITVNGDGTGGPLDLPIQGPFIDGSGVVFIADFDGGVDGFEYLDDAVYGTSEPHYVDGSTSGGYGSNDSDALRIRFRGRNDADVPGMSGAWIGSFNMPVSAQATLSFLYRSTENAYESGECRDVVIQVDSVIVEDNGEDYVARHCGASEQQSLAEIILDLGVLAAGEHTLALGAYLNGKTDADENAYVYFDDVTVTMAPPAGTAAAIIDEDFEGGAGAFSYADDTFHTSSQPAYANGTIDSEGHDSGNAALVQLGGVDSSAVNGMSGGWSVGLSLASNNRVTLDFYYRLQTTGDSNDLEGAEALVALDDIILEYNGPRLDNENGETVYDDPVTQVASDFDWVHVYMDLVNRPGFAGGSNS